MMARSLKSLSRLGYHWTDRESAAAILRDGLREGSYFARKPWMWWGEVCLRLRFGSPTYWYQRGASRWQRCADGIVPPSQIRVLTRPRRDPKRR